MLSLGDDDMDTMIVIIDLEPIGFGMFALAAAWGFRAFLGK